MLNFERASKIIEAHFTNLTDEEFINNLKEYCPRVFKKDEFLDKNDSIKHSSTNEKIINQSSNDSK